ncbi:MAG: hypothetical protein LBK94_04660, partial [Prevotellaceae bacterium]|nr:hypothetical protein [Prevotellaceae bacterium]
MNYKTSIRSHIITYILHYYSDFSHLFGRYDALRDFFAGKRSAREVARQYGYTVTSLYSLARDFRHHL